MARKPSIQKRVSGFQAKATDPNEIEYHSQVGSEEEQDNETGTFDDYSDQEVSEVEEPAYNSRTRKAAKPTRTQQSDTAYDDVGYSRNRSKAAPTKPPKRKASQSALPPPKDRNVPPVPVAGLRATKRGTRGNGSAPAQPTPSNVSKPASDQAQSRGGLFSRLIKIRNREANEADAAAAAAATNDPASRGKGKASRRSSSTGVPAATKVPGPRETLGIDAFGKSRVSRANSAYSGTYPPDDEEVTTTLPPLKRAGTTQSNTKIIDQEAGKLPGFGGPPGQTSRHPSISRYSIAHSVEPELVDSWSMNEGRARAPRRHADDRMTDDAYSGFGPAFTEGSITSDWRRSRQMDFYSDEDETDFRGDDDISRAEMVTDDGSGPLPYEDEDDEEEAEEDEEEAEGDEDLGTELQETEADATMTEADGTTTTAQPVSKNARGAAVVPTPSRKSATPVPQGSRAVEVPPRKSRTPQPRSSQPESPEELEPAARSTRTHKARDAALGALTGGALAEAVNKKMAKGRSAAPMSPAAEPFRDPPLRARRSEDVMAQRTRMPRQSMQSLRNTPRRGDVSAADLRRSSFQSPREMRSNGRTVSRDRAPASRRVTGNTDYFDISRDDYDNAQAEADADNDDNVSVVDRLLAKLEADEGRGQAAAEEEEDDDDYAEEMDDDVTAEPRSHQNRASTMAGMTGAPSEFLAGEDEAPIKPDDSVSIRAAKRAAQEQRRRDAVGAGAAAAAPVAAVAGRRSLGQEKPQPKSLAQRMATVEPEMLSESDPEDANGLPVTQDEEPFYEEDSDTSGEIVPEPLPVPVKRPSEARLRDRALQPRDSKPSRDRLVEQPRDLARDRSMDQRGSKVPRDRSIDQRRDLPPQLLAAESRRYTQDSRGYGDRTTAPMARRDSRDLLRRDSRDIGRRDSRDPYGASRGVVAPVGYGRNAGPDPRGPSTARSRRKAPRGPGEVGRQSWLLDSSLSAEQLHYFVKEMVSSELEWEMQRLFAFDPRGLPRSYDLDVGREFEIFRKGVSLEHFAPEMPLIRFLYESAFVMLPMFGKRKTTYEKRRRRGEYFWRKSGQPLLRLIQSKSFSQRMDRYGEGDGSFFAARSTLDILSSCLKGAAVRYITATLRVGNRDVKQSWPWPGADMMDIGAFTPYRIPLDKQRARGGYSVDVVEVRPVGNSAAYILEVRRRGAELPPYYIIRNEQQFEAYARAIMGALPKACIKPPPSIDMAQLPAHYRELIRSVDQSTAAGKERELLPGQERAPQQQQQQQQRQPDKKASNADLKSRFSNLRVDDGQQSKDSKSQGRSGLFGSLRGGKGNAESSSILADTRNGESRSSLPLSSGSDATEEPPSATGNSTTLVGSTKWANLPSSGGFFGMSKAPKGGSTVNYDLRRVQLRDWLRDVLSARGAGHNSETKAFLSANAFTDKDLKKTTKEKIDLTKRTDEASTRQREEMALQAGEEVKELREDVEAMWEECVVGNGFLRAQAVFEEASSFASLPEEYQGMVSYLHLKLARFLDGAFVSSDQAANNMRRARAVYKAIPWKLLTVVMSESTGTMIKNLHKIFTSKVFLQKMTKAIMDDDEEAIGMELAMLKERLPSDYLLKIRRFVEVLPDDTKRIIRAQAEKAGIPLVAAIERGSDAPLLHDRDLSRIMNATKAYQRFIGSRQPTMIEIEAEARRNKDIALVRDLQYALRLYSLRRDGQAARDVLRSRTFREAIPFLIEPLQDYLAKLHHRKAPLGSAISTARSRFESLLELLEALRMRIQDPARSIDAITTFLDAHAHDTVAVLSALSPMFAFMHEVAHTIAGNSHDLSREWYAPQDLVSPNSSRSFGNSRSSRSSGDPLSSNPATMQSIDAVTEAAWSKRVRQMEVCTRWIAGDIEADQEIIVLGGSAPVNPASAAGAEASEGKSKKDKSSSSKASAAGIKDNMFDEAGLPATETRMRRIVPDEPARVRLDTRVFRDFAPGFREAVARALESRAP